MTQASSWHLQCRHVLTFSSCVFSTQQRRIDPQRVDASPFIYSSFHDLSYYSSVSGSGSSFHDLSYYSCLPLYLQLVQLLQCSFILFISASLPMSQVSLYSLCSCPVINRPSECLLHLNNHTHLNAQVNNNNNKLKFKALFSRQKLEESRYNKEHYLLPGIFCRI